MQETTTPNWQNFAVVVLMIPACISAARGDTHYVNANSLNPQEPFTSPESAAHQIQPAVDASAEGDTVQVAAGQYTITKPIVVNKAVTLHGAGAETSTIDAAGNCGCIVLDRGAILVGFTITGGKARQGGGVVCGPGTTLAECTITGNTAERNGGGVRTTSGRGDAPVCLVRDCNIIDNCVVQFMHTDHPWGGGGVYADGSTTVRNCLIKDNRAAQRGGGIWCHGGSTDS